MRDVILSGGVLGLALVGAYLTWTADTPEKAEDAVDIYRAQAGAVENVAWRSDELTVEVSKRADAKGDYFWIEVTETIEEEVAPEEKSDEAQDMELAPEPALEGPEAAEAQEEAEEQEAPVETITRTETSAFLGSSTAESTWASFEPLTAVRVFADADPQSAVFGLDDPEATIEVTRSGEVLSLAVGNEPYGSKNRYVSSDGKVYMVAEKALRPLEFAKTRLIERGVQPNEPDAAETVTVNWQDSQRVWVHTNKDDKKARFWADQATPGERDDAADSWLSKIFRLRVADYLPEAELESTVEPVFAYTVSGDEGEWTVEVLRELESDEEGKEPAYYARSEYSRSMVRLSRSLAAEAAADLEEVFAE